MSNFLDLDPDGLHFIPLGGSEQFGVNFNLYAHQGKVLGIDLGIGFADNSMPGIDIMLPDPTVITDDIQALAGLIITHAHEDHIGAVPYLWPRLKCPIYCTPFTAAVLRRKFEEKPECKKAEIHIVKPGERINIGPFEVEFIHVSHSIPQAVSVAIHTKAGTIMHSGDWNLDPAPVLDAPTDEKAFQALGKKGVLAYIGDSTNSGVPGRAGSEDDVEKGLEAVFQGCKGRIAVTSFSSNVGRMQSIMKAADAVGRSVCVIGRSMHNMVGAAKQCGYLSDVPNFVTEDDLSDIPADQQVLIVTGSQGEPRAALSKISRGEFSKVKLTHGDTVIFSARSIPGNEKEIDSVKNDLLNMGIQVIGPDDTSYKIHVSGHPYQDEVADMYRWLKPQIVVPVHGERMQLEAQAALARRCQVPTVIVPQNGSVVRLDGKNPAIIDHVETGLYAVEQGRIIDADHAAIRERRKLQYTGALHVSVALNARGELADDPQITMLGLIDYDNDDEVELEDDLLDDVEDTIIRMRKKKIFDDDAIAEQVRLAVRRHVSRVLRIKPIVSVHFLRV
jgi:ribonuclease J